MEWPSWSKDLNAGSDGNGRWDADSESKWDATGPSWRAEDISKSFDAERANNGSFTAAESAAAQYLDCLRGQMAPNQDITDLSSSSSCIQGSHRAYRDTSLKPLGALLSAHPQVCSAPALEAQSPATRREPTAQTSSMASDAGADALGTKVSLNVLFPNMERGPQEDFLKASLAMDRRTPTSVVREPPNSQSSDWRSEQRFQGAPGLTNSFQPSGSSARAQPQSMAALDKDWNNNTSNIAESVAAMALGLDMDDDTPQQRRREESTAATAA